MLSKTMSVLDQQDRERIHRAALTVLEKRGFLVEEDQLRRQLKERGASEAPGNGYMTIPSELVTESLQSMNREPVLYSVNGKALRHRAGDRYYGSLVTDPYIVDYQEGIRKPLLQDIEQHARLGDALPLIDSIHLMDDTIPGMDSVTSELKCMEAFVANTTTSYHCAPGSMTARIWDESGDQVNSEAVKSNSWLLRTICLGSDLNDNGRSKRSIT